MTVPDTDSAFQDAVWGMLILGAYGDALGAPHEHAGLGMGGERVIDPVGLGRLMPGSTFYDAGSPGSPWWVWADADEVQDMDGVLTDDTACRMMILHHWLAGAADETWRLEEEDLRAWMARELSNTHLPGLPSGVNNARVEQIKAWLEMFRAERTSQSAGFFKPGAPVVFGLFIYLELAGTFSYLPAYQVYTKFRDLCALDQTYAKIVTGILAGLLAPVIGRGIAPESFTEDFITRARVLLTLASDQAQSDEERSHLALMREALDEMVRFGETHRNIDNADGGKAFLEDFYHSIYTDGDRIFRKAPEDLIDYNPLLFWMQIISALTYAGDKPLHALRLLAAGVGDADTVPSMLGTIMGAALGYRRLITMALGEIDLAPEFKKIIDNLNALFNADIARSIRVFEQIEMQNRANYPSSSFV